LDKINRQNKFQELRKAYPFFVFQSYSIFKTKTNLRISFLFELGDRFSFRPELEIPFRDFYTMNKIPDMVLENFVFQIGMVELISYWKTACPPKVLVRAGYLDKEQIAWWKKLYYNGLGEFFYLNGIQTDKDSFMEIVPEGGPKEISTVFLNDEQVLVPVGGGKDSVVSLELLKNNGLAVKPFLLNPRKAALRTIKIAGFSTPGSVVVNRRLDPQLLDLNKTGFLNGHTPFSALLAFVSALTAILSGVGNIALSNESSASQSTVPGTNINHQYSKSFEFEQDFVWYMKKYMHPGLHYFSFLRPLNELQIASLFSKFPRHHYSFRSCNVGSKTDSWCGHCPKCLFTYVILSPFLSQVKLEKIFGKNLLKDKSLSTLMDELDGRVEVKPFECVGTPEEVNAAVLQTVHISQGYQNLPLIQRVLESEVLQDNELFEKLLSGLNSEHFLPDKFFLIIKKAMADVTV